MTISLKSPQSLHAGSGFTIIELLVSMAVLSLMIALVAQLMNSATTTTTLSGKQAEADNIARAAFNVMESDFGGMVIRPDADYFFYKNNQSGTPTGSAAPGNDSMWFYSNAPSYFTSGTNSAAANDRASIAFVGYRIPTVNNRPDKGGTTSNATGLYPSYALERVGLPMQRRHDYAPHYLTWPAPSPGATASPNPYSNSTIRGGSRFNDINYPMLGSAPYTDGAFRTSHAPTHVIAAEVFRMEFCFVKKDGTYFIPGTPDTTATSKASVDAATDMRGIGTGDVKGVVVAIAVLDAKSRAVVSPDLKLAAGALKDIQQTDLDASPPKLMAQKWTENLADPSFATTAKIPVVAASQIRVYQRTFAFGPQ